MTALAPTLLVLLLTQVTQAEKIARLERSLETDRKQLEELRQETEANAREYQEAQAEFTALDEQLRKKTREEETLRKQGKTAEADALHRREASLRNRWRRGRERFDLALQERKALQEKSETLQRRIQKEEAELDRILGVSAAAPDLIGKLFEQAAAAPSGAEARKEDKRKEERQLAAAREQVQKASEAAQQARKRAQTLTERLDALRQEIAVEERLRDTARRKSELARKTRQALERELRRAPEPQRPGLRDRLTAADTRHAEALREEQEAADRLNDLQAGLATLQTEQIEVLAEEEARNREADAAQRQLASLEGPLSAWRVLTWARRHGLSILFIVVAIVMLRWLVRRVSRRIARLVIQSTALGRTDLEDRSETLATVFNSTASVAIVITGVLMILEHLGVPVVPLLGGAAVLGLAVAFGAQNLVKDYFTGFMILLEDQYAVNDIIKVNGSLGGKVEKISLRMTTLRDNAGIAHFVPHGTITTVSNMSHGWARAALDVRIAYREDTDRVMEVLRQLCAELKSDEKFGPLLLEDAELLGVDELAESAVVLKFVIRTRAQEQWKVRRELLRRIKRRFEELRIEIPFPCRTVYHRYDTPSVAA